MEDGLPSLGVGERRVLAWEQLGVERRAWVLLVLQRIDLATVEKSDNDKKDVAVLRVTSKWISPQNKHQNKQQQTDLQMYHKVSKLTGVHFIRLPEENL